ncbi:hypothetical protein [Streptomyces nigra]|uniref:hypothetical protein n=1 Tax=Streptomyces nigra TaxID=1827580 RepID=UPI003418F069
MLLLIADAGVEKAPVDDRSIPFWLFTAVAVLGAASTVVRLRRMVNAHHRRALPGWTRFLGALLVMYASTSPTASPTAPSRNPAQVSSGLTWSRPNHA